MSMRSEFALTSTLAILLVGPPSPCALGGLYEVNQHAQLGGVVGGVVGSPVVLGGTAFLVSGTGQVYLVPVDSSPNDVVYPSGAIAGNPTTAPVFDAFLNRILIPTPQGVLGLDLYDIGAGSTLAIALPAGTTPLGNPVVDSQTGVVTLASFTSAGGQVQQFAASGTLLKTLALGAYMPSGGLSVATGGGYILNTTGGSQYGDTLVLTANLDKYDPLCTFTAADADPTGQPLVANGYVYGTSRSGGAWDINEATGQFAELAKDPSGATTPVGGPSLSATGTDLFYSNTVGGADGYGDITQVDLQTGVATDIYNFTISVPDGQFKPSPSTGVLYGAYGDNIVSIDPKNSAAPMVPEPPSLVSMGIAVLVGLGIVTIRSWRRLAWRDRYLSRQG